MSNTIAENATVEQLKEMIQHAMHLGHPTHKWHPRMRKYLYGKENGIHIFDLNKTHASLQTALNFVETLGKEGKTLLFVSTKPQAQQLIVDAAKKCNTPYVDSKWFPGLITNFSTLKSRIQHFKDLKQDRESGELETKYLKKEVAKFNKEIEKLENALGGVENLSKLPNALFITDIKREAIAVTEASKLGIPIIAIVDSNVNPDLIAYPIPANDDGIKSLEYVINKISESYLKGKEESGRK